jgi:hypothetical protein
MNVILNVSELPEKIKQCILQNYSFPEQEYLFAFKTSYKPNATIPIIWFVQLRDRISFCNTHKTRGVYKEIINTSVNSIRLSRSALTMDVVYKSLDQDDLIIDLDKNIDIDEVSRYLNEVGFEVTVSR